HGAGGYAQESPLFEARNCQFTHPSLLSYYLPASGRLVFENNVIGAKVMDLALHCMRQDVRDVSVRLAHNTLTTRGIPLVFYLDRPVDPPPAGPDPSARPIRIEAVENVFQGPETLFRLETTPIFLGRAKPLRDEQAEDLLRRLAAWRGRGNRYVLGTGFLSLA